jgi:hypothetical protein
MNCDRIVRNLAMPTDSPVEQASVCARAVCSSPALVMKKILLSLPLLAAVTLPAQVYLNETFSYADGPLTNVSGQAWAIHSGTIDLNVVSGAAFIHQNDVAANREDVNRLLNTTFDATTDNTSKIYGSFSINYSSLPITGNSDGSYFAHLKSSAAGEFYARIGANTVGAAAGTFRLAVANEGGYATGLSTPVEYTVDLSLNTTYQVVFRYDLATDQTTLWVNPTDESSFSVTALDAVSYAAGTINAYALRQGTTGTGAPGDLALDNLIIGGTFADVTTVVPEPSTYAFVGMGLAAFWFMTRRRQA